MKYIQLFFVFALMAAPVLAWSQDDEEPLIPQEDIDELLMWMVDGKYEKVLYKAIRYTEDDKTDDAPRPYAYMSMAYFRIFESDDPDFAEDYSNALKEALKYATKYIKKDKEEEYISEFEEYFDELRAATISESDVHIMDEKYTKAKSFYSYLVKLDGDDIGAQVMLGTILWKNRAKRDAEEAWDLAKSLLAEYGDKGLSEVQRNLLRMAVIWTAETLEMEGMRSDAIKWINLTSDYFESDKEFAAVKRSIGG
jgi:tetratricopeptide (TPR) repeat protein